MGPDQRAAAVRVNAVRAGAAEGTEGPGRIPGRYPAQPDQAGIAAGVIGAIVLGDPGAVPGAGYGSLPIDRGEGTFAGIPVECVGPTWEPATAFGRTTGIAAVGFGGGGIQGRCDHAVPEQVSPKRVDSDPGRRFRCIAPAEPCQRRTSPGMGTGSDRVGLPDGPDVRLPVHQIGQPAAGDDPPLPGQRIRSNDHGVPERRRHGRGAGALRGGDHVRAGAGGVNDRMDPIFQPPLAAPPSVGYSPRIHQSVS